MHALTPKAPAFVAGEDIQGLNLIQRKWSGKVGKLCPPRHSAVYNEVNEMPGGCFRILMWMPVEQFVHASFAAEAHQALGERAALAVHADVEFPLAPELALHLLFHVVNRAVHALGIVAGIHGRLSGDDKPYFGAPDIGTVPRPARVAPHLHLAPRHPDPIAQ